MSRRHPRPLSLNLLVKQEQQCLFPHLEQAPQIVQFESISGCNADCSFCAYPGMKRPKGLMPLPLLEQVVRQSSHARSLIPFLLGEPFLDGRLREILSLCKRLQPAAMTVIYSNMSLCDQETAAWLVSDQTLDVLCPSFYGPTPDIYRQLQPPLDFHIVRQNILHLLRERQLRGKQKPLVAMQYLLTEQTAPYAAQFQRYWQAVADQVSFVRFDTWHGLKPDQSPPDLPNYPPGPIPCSRLWDSLNMHHDGTVVACCVDLEAEAVIGHFPEQSLQEIWHGQPLRALRRLHLAGQQGSVSPCRDCTSWRSNPQWWVDFWAKSWYGVNPPPPRKLNSQGVSS